MEEDLGRVAGFSMFGVSVSLGISRPFLRTVGMAAMIKGSKSFNNGPRSGANNTTVAKEIAGKKKRKREKTKVLAVTSISVVESRLQLVKIAEHSTIQHLN